MDNCRVSKDELDHDHKQSELDDLLEAFKSSLAYELAVTSKLVELRNNPDLINQLRAEAEEYVEENWRDYE
jgi:hypothetical protein